MGGEFVINDAAPALDEADETVAFGGGGDAITIEIEVTDDDEVELAVFVMLVDGVGDEVAGLDGLAFGGVGDADAG